MITIYLKQSYNLLKENRFVNGISIAGTALSVAAVMLIYLVYQVNFSAYAPESNRYRILFVSSLQACGQFYDKYAIKFTDDGFWQVFDFTFLAGGPFTHTDWESGIRKAVISDKLARRLFGTVEAVGQTLRMNYAVFLIRGVV